MKIKGTAVKSIKNYIKKEHPQRYEDWINSLPNESSKYFKESILSGDWYPVQNAFIIPTENAGKLFFDNDIEKAAYELGKFSAYEALSGIYKIFVRIASMNLILKKLKTIFATYFSTGSVIIIDEGNVKYFKLIGFTINEKIMVMRIAGWAEGLFDTIGKKPSRVTHSIKLLEDDMIDGIVKVEWFEN